MGVCKGLGNRYQRFGGSGEHAQQRTEEKRAGIYGLLREPNGMDDLIRSSRNAREKGVAEYDGIFYYVSPGSYNVWENANRGEEQGFEKKTDGRKKTQQNVE